MNTTDIIVFDKYTFIVFTKKEVERFNELAEQANYIDENFYNVPFPEENKQDEFLQFKNKYIKFFNLFIDFHNSGTYKYKHRRTIEMDNLFAKLINNMELLKSNEKYSNNINEWSLIRGNNIEIDNIINNFITISNNNIMSNY